MWSTIGIIAAFLAIIVLVIKHVMLGYALLIGSAIAGLSSGLGLRALLSVSLKSLTAPGTVTLLVTLVLISILGSLMKQLGVLDKMVDALQKVLRNAKLTILFIPSIMGTLMVTGGAMMAAPMVDSLGERLRLGNDHRAAINLLYRHAWYFVFPFAPTFILVKEIANVPINRLILIQAPLTIVAVWAGYHAWLRQVRDENPRPAPPTRGDYLDLLRYTSPIWSSLLLALVGGVPFQLALVLGVALALFYGKADPRQIPLLLWKGIQWPVVLSGVSIMIFKDVLAAAGTLNSVTDGLLNIGLPLEMIVILLPALVGLVSASATSSIGITLPLLLPALQQSGHLTLFCAAAYAAAYLGYYASPLHLCQVLTLEFFDVKLDRLYRAYALPVPAMWLTLIGIVVVGRWIW
ncbi:MAG: DUF401 family protein [Bacillota bacterium]|jgi:integral membrane protein (TIGR00529 family)